MTCEEFQQRIWLEESTRAMREHMSLCSDCKTELELYQLMMKEVDRIEVPPLTKSIVPSDDWIHSAFQARRRRKWAKATTLAASIVLLLGIGGPIGLKQLEATHLHLNSSSSSADHTSSTSQSAANTGSYATKAGTDPQDQVNATNKRQLIVDDVPSTIPGGQFWQALRKYLQQHVSALDVQHIHIDTLSLMPDQISKQTIDTIQDTAKTTQLTATLSVDLQTGADNSTEFRNGQQVAVVNLANENEWVVKGFQVTEYKLGFEEVQMNQLPETVYTFVQENKTQKGTYRIDDNGNTYLLIVSGKDPSSGYTLRVENVMETKDSIKVETSYFRPGSSGDPVPYAVIKIKPTNKKIDWVDFGYA